MFATTHVLTGAVIGRRIRQPIAALAVGAASHLVLDALPHWGVDIATMSGRRAFGRIAVADGVTMLAALGWIHRRYGAGPELAGALGALTLDMDKPAAVIGVRQLWPDWLHRTHVDIQTGERPTRWPIDVTVAAFAGLSLCAGRIGRRGEKTDAGVN